MTTKLIKKIIRCSVLDWTLLILDQVNSAEIHPSGRLHVLILKETEGEVPWPESHCNGGSLKSV